MYNQIKKEEVLREKKALEKKLEAKRMLKLIEEQKHEIREYTKTISNLKKEHAIALSNKEMQYNSSSPMKGRSSEIEQPFDVAATGESGHSGAIQDSNASGDDQNDEESKNQIEDKMNDLDNLNFNGITSARKPVKNDNDVFESVSNNSVIYNGDEDGEFGKLEDNSDIFDKADHEKEYFMMSVLALKMMHQEQYDADYLQDIGEGDQIYEEVQQMNLPFHKWYKWIEKTFWQLKNDYEMKNNSEFDYVQCDGNPFDLNEDNYGSNDLQYPPGSFNTVTNSKSKSFNFRLSNIEDEPLQKKYRNPQSIIKEYESGEHFRPDDRFENELNQSMYSSTSTARRNIYLEASKQMLEKKIQ